MDNQKRLAYFLRGISVLIVFLILAICVYLELGWIKALDQFGNQMLRLGIPDSYFNFFVEITDLGYGNQVVLFGMILILILFIYKKSLAAIWTLGTLVISGILVPILLKILVLRARPEDRLVFAGGYSFPSGHSTLATVFYGLIIIWSLMYLKKKGLKIAFTLISSILILLIMWSRVYLGVHYFSDVIGGLLLGIGQLLIAVSLYWKFQTRPRG